MSSRKNLRGADVVVFRSYLKRSTSRHGICSSQRSQFGRYLYGYTDGVAGALVSRGIELYRPPRLSKRRSTDAMPVNITRHQPTLYGRRGAYASPNFRRTISLVMNISTESSARESARWRSLMRLSTGMRVDSRHAHAARRRLFLARMPDCRGTRT